jgi:hypothetical protein
VSWTKPKRKRRAGKARAESRPAQAGRGPRLHVELAWPHSPSEGLPDSRKATRHSGAIPNDGRQSMGFAVVVNCKTRRCASRWGFCRRAAQS